MPSPRYAIYFVPQSDTPLGSFGAGILGYDPNRAERIARIDLRGIGHEEGERATAEPARYGFHATLKAPFYLQPGRAARELLDAADEFASRTPAVPLGTLRIESIGAFLALRPERDTSAIGSLAAECVRAFDGFRAPLGANDRARRVAAGLTPRQTELLDRWGYPYVMEEFRFHMTLTGSLSEERRAAWRDALAEAYRPHEDEVLLDSLAIVMQEAPSSRFRVVHRASLKG